MRGNENENKEKEWTKEWTKRKRENGGKCGKATIVT